MPPGLRGCPSRHKTSSHIDKGIEHVDRHSTLAAHAQAEEKPLGQRSTHVAHTQARNHKTRMALAHQEKNRLSTNPRTAQALNSLHHIPQRAARRRAPSPPPTGHSSIANTWTSPHIQTADSNAHSHQRQCVTATSRIVPLSAPNSCFHNASIWTHPMSKDGALHISISPTASFPSAT